MPCFTMYDYEDRQLRKLLLGGHISIITKAVNGNATRRGDLNERERARIKE